jgi:hypothetical protein
MLSFVLLRAASLLADAQGTLDQSFTSPNNAGADINDGFAFVAQTYTAGLNGSLAGVNIEVQAFSSLYPLRVTILAVSNGVPTSLLLGETVLFRSDAPLGFYVSFQQPILQQTGQQYAIAVNYFGAPPPSPINTLGLWSGASGDIYTGGSMFSSRNGASWDPGLSADLHFRTYVTTIPEAATLTLAWLGSAVLLISRRRK